MAYSYDKSNVWIRFQPWALFSKVFKIDSNGCNYAEADNGGVLSEKLLSEILQNSQEKTCARVSFLTK